jgi:hypothetical protein
MAWSSPMTAVTGNVFTAAQFNQHVRDNLNTTAPAVATTAGGIIVTTAANVVIQRTPQVAFVGTDESTATTTYVDLTTLGPAVTVTSGTKALVTIGGGASNNTIGLASRIAAAVSGATTIAAADADSFLIESGNVSDHFQGTWTYITTALNSGSNTFTAKYRTSAGGGVSNFDNRLITVTPF